MKTCLLGTVQCRSPTFPVAAKLGPGPPAGKQEKASSPEWNPLRPQLVRPTKLCGTQDPHMVAVRTTENHCGPWPVAAASLGNVLEMQALRTHPGLRSLGMESRLPGWFQCALRFETYWPRVWEKQPISDSGEGLKEYTDTKLSSLIPTLSFLFPLTLEWNLVSHSLLIFVCKIYLCSYALLVPFHHQIVTN